LLENAGVIEKRTIDSRVWGSSLVDGAGSVNCIAYWSDANTLTYNADYTFDAATIRQYIGSTASATSYLTMQSVTGTIALSSSDAKYDIFGWGVNPQINGFRANGTRAVTTATALNDCLHGLNGYGRGTTVWNTSARGAVGIYASEAMTNSANGTHLRFSTTKIGTTTTTEGMRLTDRGNLLVGTTSDAADNRCSIVGTYTDSGINTVLHQNTCFLSITANDAFVHDSYQNAIYAGGSASTSYTNQVRGFLGAAYLSTANAVTVNLLAGGVGAVGILDKGTVTAAYCFNAGLYGPTGSGTINNFYGFSIGNFANSSVIPQNSFGFYCSANSTAAAGHALKVGVYIGAQTGATTSNYGLYALGASTYHYLENLVGIGVTTATARLHLAAGTASASSAPLKFNAGTRMSTPESGAIESYNGNLYFTDATPARHQLNKQQWKQLVTTTEFSTTAASTSTISMNVDLTGSIKVGMPIKFVLSSVTYYAIVTAIASNLLTIAGAPLTTGAGALTALWYSDHAGQAEVMSFAIGGNFADGADTTLLVNDLNTYVKWTKAPAYLVMISHREKTTAGTTNPNVNVDIAGANPVSTSNTNQGRAVATSWTDTVVDINTSNYDIVQGDSIEIRTTADIGTHASDLTVQLTFVYA
jgi:hypothetical protein